MDQPVTLRIDVVSDVVCPWCIVGYKRLEKAITQFKGQVNFELHWHPFELNPDMPQQGQNLREHLAEKYGSTPEDSRRARANLVQLGEQLGFTFNFSDESRIFNTFKAHQLLYWAAEYSRQSELKMALFEVYFTDQKNPSDIDNLLVAVEKAGLDSTEAKAIIDDGRYIEAVRTEQQQWTAQGIQAVPAFIFDQKYLVSGAQEVSTLQEVIQTVLNEKQ